MTPVLEIVIWALRSAGFRLSRKGILKSVYNMVRGPFYLVEKVEEKVEVFVKEKLLS